MMTEHCTNFDFVILRRQRAYFREEWSQYGGSINIIIKASGENGLDRLGILRMA